ncbi:MAG: KH domain-containing protein [Firmicutes bacterium]|nr:KH domain-containing protein [Bacillota bacterium]
MNLDAFLRDVLTPLLDHPEALRIEIQGEGRRQEVLIHADPKDRGRIIGKSGRMISALRTLCQAAGDKAGLRVSLEIFEEEGDRPARSGRSR